MRRQVRNAIFFGKTDETGQHIQPKQSTPARVLAKDGNTKVLSGDFDAHDGLRNDLHQLVKTPTAAEKTTTNSQYLRCRCLHPPGRLHQKTSSHSLRVFLESDKRRDDPKDPPGDPFSDKDHPNSECWRAGFAGPEGPLRSLGTGLHPA